MNTTEAVAEFELLPMPYFPLAFVALLRPRHVQPQGCFLGRVYTFFRPDRALPSTSDRWKLGT